MHKISTKLFLILFIGGGALVLSLFFRGQINFLSSSFVGDIYNPEQTEEPYPTEPPLTVDCSETHSISGPSSVSFTEASGPATYLVTLNRPSDSQATISSITVEAIPKNTPAINYKHPADGSGAGVPWMTWSTQSLNPNGLSAIIKTSDYAWYGVPGNHGMLPDGLDPAWSSILDLKYPTLGFYSNKQSMYDIHITAILSNDCALKYSFEMQVKFEDLNDNNYSRPTLKFEKKNEWITTVQPFPSLFKFKKIYKVCTNASDVLFWVTAEETVETKGSYKPAVMAEEVFHSRQSRGEVGWSQGGSKEIPPVLKEIFVGTKFCASGTSPEIAKNEAFGKIIQTYFDIRFEFNENFDSALTKLQSLSLQLSNLSEYQQRAILIGCWKEKTAKEAAGFTPNKYGGVMLEQAYVGCKQDMQKPEGHADFLRKNLDEYRGFAQGKQ